MHKIGFIVYPAFSPMNLAATSVFETANWKIGSNAYEVTLLSEHGGPVATSLGSKIQTSSFKRRTFDTLIIAGSISAPAATPGVLNYLRSAFHRSRRIASICTGALVLAEAGLLDGRRATTHWYYAKEMQRRYPKIAVHEDRIFMIDGPIWTSAGMSAGVDLALALLADESPSWGRAVAVLDVVGPGRGIRSHPDRGRLRERTFERAVVGSSIGTRRVSKPAAIQPTFQGGNRTFTREGN